VLNETAGPTILAVQFVQTTTTEGAGRPPSYTSVRSPEDLPPLTTGVDRISAVVGHPYTVVSTNHRVRWRMLVTVLDNGAVLHLGVNLSTAESTVGRLIFLELLFGSAALILLATIGVAMVRTSLRPLREIERTAAALLRFFERGVIRAIGVSNFSVAQLEAFRAVAPVHVVQSPYNLFERQVERDVLPYADREGLTREMSEVVGTRVKTA